MKKRVISLVMVLAFAVSSLSVCASALGTDNVIEWILQKGFTDIVNGDNLEFWIGLYPNETVQFFVKKSII